MSDLTKKSGIVYLSVFLLVICGVATAVMGIVAMLTKKPIADREAAMIANTLKQVLPAFQKTDEKTVPGRDASFYTAFSDDGQTVVGYAVRSTTTTGYGGRVEALVGFTPDRKIYNVVVTSHNETPGIGTKVMNRERVRTVSDVLKGIKAEDTLPPNIALDSYNGKALSDPLDSSTVHFISGATVSSNAALDVIRNAQDVLKQTFKEEK